MRQPLARIINIVGPAAVMAAGTMGAGSTASLILAGAWFGYELLWVALFILPLFVIAIDSAARIGLVNPDQGMFALICRHIHPGVAWLILVINVPVHLFIAMGHMSVMTSASLALFDYYPASEMTQTLENRNYHRVEILLSLVFAALLVWVLVSEGYQRMQKMMTVFMVLMFFCFLIVALRGFTEIDAILAGFVPGIPDDLPVPAQDTVRSSEISMLAIVGSVLAPASMLGISYMSADNRKTSVTDFRQEFRKSVINLGVFYGGYSLFVIIAGGFALFPLAHHAEIDSVHEASRILVRAFPQGFEHLGPMIFSIGMVMAAMTTFVVVVEVISYFILDMFGYDWHYTKENRRFKKILVICIVLPSVLAPFWTFPALLKNLLLMGINAVVIPLVFLVILILVNRKSIMGEHRAGRLRNIILAAGLLLSVSLSIYKIPEFIRIFTA